VSSIRSEVWKYLFGYYPWDSTIYEREKIDHDKLESYHVIRNQWKSISAEQENNWTSYRNRIHRIQKDVVRTDRFQDMYLDNDSTHLKVLNDVMLTYAFYNWDLGYVQGMNDLVVPIQQLIQEEHIIFWCFKGLLDKIGSNFRKDQVGVHAQFSALVKLLKILDIELYQYLESNDSISLYCYRWILIAFKREFDIESIFEIWEAWFSNYYHPDFNLFLVIAMLSLNRKIIIDENLMFDEIFAYFATKKDGYDGKQCLIKTLELLAFFDKNATPQEKDDIFK